MFPRHTPETIIFRDPTDERVRVEDQIYGLYTEGLPPMPTPVQRHHPPFTKGDFLPLHNKGDVPSVMDD
jgi:hypothetical protein